MKGLKKYVYTISIVTYLFISCSESKEQHSGSKDHKVYTLIKDSLHFGKQGKYFVEALKQTDNENSTIQIYFENKVGDSWNLIDSYSREITEVLEPNVTFSDYNFDGYNDISYISDLGMNGSNEIRTVILFKPTENRIKVLDNSIEYPNLRINQKKHLLVSTIFSGSTQNVFCRINADSLQRIAMLEFDTNLNFTEYGNGKVTAKKKVSELHCDRFTRFIDYNPIRIE
jgi:hypothetical protein